MDPLLLSRAHWLTARSSRRDGLEPGPRRAVTHLADLRQAHAGHEERVHPAQVLRRHVVLVVRHAAAVPVDGCDDEAARDASAVFPRTQVRAVPAALRLRQREPTGPRHHPGQSSVDAVPARALVFEMHLDVTGFALERLEQSMSRTGSIVCSIGRSMITARTALTRGRVDAMIDMLAPVPSVRASTPVGVQDVPAIAERAQPAAVRSG